MTRTICTLGQGEGEGEGGDILLLLILRYYNHGEGVRRKRCRLAYGRCAIGRCRGAERNNQSGGAEV